MKTSIVVCLTLASLLAACTEATQAPWSSERSATTSADLGAVQNCIAQSKSCVAAASTTSALSQCEQELKSCLDGLIAEAGAPSLPAFDAGAGLPPGFSFDAGSLPSFDASFPGLPDAALPTFPGSEAGASASACIQDLETCLQSSTSPTTCASQATTCLEQAI